MIIKSKIKRWGNSQGINIPKDMMKAINLLINQEVDLKTDIKNQQLIIKPIQTKDKEARQTVNNWLNEQSKNPNSENLWGQAEGSEQW